MKNANFYVDCVTCKQKYRIPPSRESKTKFCSYACKAEQQRGRKLSQETKEKISLRHKGKPFSGTQSDWNGKKHTEESKEKMSLARKGKAMPIKTRLKISKTNRKNKEKSHLWRGGITDVNQSVRTSSEYRIWRISVFRRDDFTCQECKTRGGILNADHIKPFAYFPKLRFEIGNGRTLCVECHRKTDTYGYKATKNKDNPRTVVQVI